MIKIIPVKHIKIWGYEIWLHSPLKGRETHDENGNKITSGPLLKIIKANKPLSVQVHPDDKLAKELENELNGKAESWYVLDAAKDSELVLGIKTLDEKIIRAALENKKFEDLLIKVNPTKGTFYNVPAGLVHGIGQNVIIFELQQSSDITYRYFDYNRQDKKGNYRKLHLAKAIRSQKNLSFNLKPFHKNPDRYQNEIAIQEFHNKPIILKQAALVVDFDKNICYKANRNEKITFKHFALVYKYD